MTEHYEKVRAAFLDRDSGGGSRWGQALLLTRGVAAWMRTVGQWLAPQLPQPPKTPVLAPTLPLKLRQPLVELMGQVILSIAKNAPS